MKKEVKYKVRLKKPMDVYGTKHPIGYELDTDVKWHSPNGWRICAGHGSCFYVPYDEGELVEYTTITVVESKVIPTDSSGDLI